jgi:type IV secretion system protein VirB11
MSRPHEAIALLEHALSPFARWWDDPAVEDILVNRPGEVFVRRGAQTTRHEVALDFIDLEGIAILAASLRRQNVGRAKPLLSCDLPDGSRLQAVLPPCVKDGTVALAIRRAKRSAPTLDQLGAGGIFADVRPQAIGLSGEDRELVGLFHGAQDAAEPEARERAWKAFLRATVKARRTHVLCGEVGSGKTYFSMGIASEIPLDDRIVTVQDSDEWSALPHRNRVDLFYSRGDQGAAQVTPNDLVEASLRLAMRWLLLQELRGAEAFSFMRARRSGHPGLTTCHAANARAVFPTLALMVRQSPAAAAVELGVIEAALRSLIDVVVHFHRPDGRFAISEVWFAAAEPEGSS